jgi:hypothetical protein
LLRFAALLAARAALRRAGAVDCEADELAALEAPVESAPLVSVSAQANPLPENMAAPTPRATANPPTRPTNNDAPMCFPPGVVQNLKRRVAPATVG